MLQKRSPVIWRKPKLKIRYGLRRYPALSRVLPGVLSGSRVKKFVVIISRGCFINQKYPFLFVLIRVFFNPGRNNYSGPVGQEAQSFPELHVFFFHDERNDIAAGTASTEAMPALPVRINKKRRCLLVMERAQRAQSPPRFLQGRILPYDSDYVSPLLYFIDNTHKLICE